MVIALTAVLGASLASAAPSTRRTFANGIWTGEGKLAGGIFGDVNMEGTGPLRFRMTICNGVALSGRLTFTERFRGAVRGQRFTGSASGTLRIRAADGDPIHVRGPVTVNATILGVSASTSATGNGEIKGEGTARRMTGDLAIEARTIQSNSSAIGSTTVEAPYVARRTATASC